MTDAALDDEDHRLLFQRFGHAIRVVFPIHFLHALKIVTKGQIPSAIVPIDNRDEMVVHHVLIQAVEPDSSICVWGGQVAEEFSAQRFLEGVCMTVEVLQRFAKFLQLPLFPPGFKVEYGRENYTTIARLLKTGAVTKQSLHMLESFFAPHDAELRRMFGGQAFW